MKIGVDFGTTRVVVAAADRGNFPLVHFGTPGGETRDWFPPVVAIRGNQRLYGWDAVASQEDESWTVVRSLKRLLRRAGPHTRLEAGGASLPLRLLLHEMMAALRVQLLEHSNLGAEPDEPLEMMLGVPASANSNQRFLTEEAAQAAGFRVIGLVNEPSAAAIEFAYRNSAERKSRAGSGLVVYDLGGGTFDVSLVTMGESEHTIEGSDGISGLGGDDFDEILAALALEQAGVQAGEQTGEQAPLSASERYRLLEECRERKEGLNPNTRKLTIDLERVRADWREVTLPVDEYYERCRPLIEQTRAVLERLLAAHPERVLDTLYVTGGGAEIPPVARILRESFGRKVRRSAYMRSASAVGLAIRATAAADEIHERSHQYFGMWREAESGGAIAFDVIFPRGVRLPMQGERPLRIERIYQPKHNIGHFRFLECSQVDSHGQPTGEIVNWEEIRFPFDPRLRDREDLAAIPVGPLENPHGIRIAEEYTCDSSGALKVRIAAEPGGYAREYTIAQQAKE